MKKYNCMITFYQNKSMCSFMSGKICEENRGYTMDCENQGEYLFFNGVYKINVLR